MDTGSVKAQAQIIRSELTILKLAEAACDTNELLETARQIALTVSIISSATRLILMECEDVTEQDIAETMPEKV